MSNTVSDLIGQIIHPAPVSPASSASPAERAAAGSESVEALLERIIYPYGRPIAKWATQRVDARASAPVPTLEPLARA